jgi:hypothetical protein
MWFLIWWLTVEAKMRKGFNSTNQHYKTNIIKDYGTKKTTKTLMLFELLLEPVHYYFILSTAFF